MKKYDLIVFIGRFQPFHNGHKAVIDKALMQAKDVLVLVGSANKPRTPKNPFTAVEREGMISLEYSDNDCLCTDRIFDYDYDDKTWLEKTKERIALYTAPDDKVAIIGHVKDESSFYLRMFPEYDFIYTDVETCARGQTYHSTQLRKVWFEESAITIGRAVPNSTMVALGRFSTNIYASLKKEHEVINDYKDSWSATPYPPTFVTVDALVVSKDQVLLIRRKNHPGKDLWALPGGFVDAGETIQAAMFRELKEETGLNGLRKRDIRSCKVFDSPTRGERGRTFSHVYASVLPKYQEPEAGDDAAEAKWFKISELKYMSREMYSDHAGIISFMLRNTRID